MVKRIVEKLLLERTVLETVAFDRRQRIKRASTSGQQARQVGREAKKSFLKKLFSIGNFPVVLLIFQPNPLLLHGFSRIPHRFCNPALDNQGPHRGRNILDATPSSCQPSIRSTYSVERSVGRRDARLYLELF